MEEDTARIIGEKLVRCPVLGCRRVVLGGNNRLFRMESLSGVYALKFYRRSATDLRDRQGVEALALAFFAGHGLSGVPRLLAVDRGHGCSLLSWIDGAPVGAIGADEVDRALMFLRHLRDVGRCEPPDRLPWAADACLSAESLVARLWNRLARLEPVLPLAADLAGFIGARVAPAIEEWSLAVRRAYDAVGLDFSAEILPRHRLASPSDFGFHNAVRRADGGLVFLDFEYFGWDDPVKLTADFILHPGMNLSEKYPEGRRRFLLGMMHLFQDDPSFVFRLETLFPVFGLCWVLIILNEFVPEGWQQRNFADSALDGAMVRSVQLRKAEMFMDALEGGGWRVDGYCR